MAACVIEAKVTVNLFAEFERDLPDFNDDDKPADAGLTVRKSDLVDRLEEAFEAVSMSAEKFADLLEILLPEEFHPDAHDAPTRFLPGTREKIEVMRKRFINRQKLFHPDDAKITESVNLSIDTRR